MEDDGDHNAGSELVHKKKQNQGGNQSQEESTSKSVTQQQPGEYLISTTMTHIYPTEAQECNASLHYGGTVATPGKLLVRTRRSNVFHSTRYQTGASGINKAGLAYPILKLKEQEDTNKCMDFYKRVQIGDRARLDLEWFHHEHPFDLVMDGASLRADTLRGGYFSRNFVEAVTRMYTTLDDKAFPGSDTRWRHFLSPAWAQGAMKASLDGGVEYIEHYFRHNFYKYKVDQCRLMVLPLVLEDQWSCYFWDFIEKEITVLDPLLMNGSVKNIRDKHNEIVTRLTDPLFECMYEHFMEFDVDFSDWKRIFRNDVSSRCKWWNSGLYAMHYAYNFNGKSLVAEITDLDLAGMRAQLLWHVMAMEDNIGTVPIAFVWVDNNQYRDFARPPTLPEWFM